MAADSPTSTPTVIPTLRYSDAQKMIEWLGNAFGFESGLVVPDGDGGIAHAQLKLGTGMVMLASVRDDEFGELQSTPARLHGNSQSAYLVVVDADVTYASAQAAGAEIVMPIKDEDYGGRGFSCLDPEGYLWNVGDYDPWA